MQGRSVTAVSKFLEGQILRSVLDLQLMQANPPVAVRASNIPRRGQRIEIGDLDALLTQHPLVVVFVERTTLALGHEIVRTRRSISSDS